MKNTTFINGLWQGLDVLRGEMELSQQLDIQLISLTHLYIESNLNLSNQLPKEQLWSQITANGYGLKERLTKSLSVLENTFPFLQGVFNFVSLPKNINDAILFQLVTNLNKYPLPPTDDFGYIVETLLYRFTREEGKRGGDYITPKSITNLLPDLLDIKNGEVYDGASGVNSLLIASFRRGEKRNGTVRLFGQERNSRTWAVGKLQLFLNGLYTSEVVLGDTLTNPLIKEGHSLKKFDYVVMNPPFSLSKWGMTKVKDELHGRFIYGLPSDTNADMAFLSHGISSLNENGKAAVILPHGVLFRGGADGKIREELLRADLIEAVIGLPNSLLSNTAIPVVVLIINKSKSTKMRSKVLFIDASKEFRGQRGQNFLEEEHIAKIVSTYRNVEEVPQYSHLATLEEIAASDWTLSISRYVFNSEIESEFGTIRVDLNRFENSSLQIKPLYEVSETFRGYNIPSISKVADKNGEYFAIQLVDVQDGVLLEDQLQKVKIDDGMKVKNYLAKEGDILISNRGGSIKIAIVPKFEGNLLLTQNFHGIRPKEGMNSLYLKAYLESPVAQAYIQSLQQGSMVKVIGLKELNNLMVPIQPLNKQQQIGEGFETAESHYQQSIKKANETRKAEYTKWYREMGIDIALSNN